MLEMYLSILAAVFFMQWFCLVIAHPSQKCDLSKFPDYFKFGAGSSSYQIEGAWNEDGKGLSILDWIYNTHPIPNATRTDDSYHKYKEDIAAIKEIGLDHYRFSLSWSRILPKGLTYDVNQAGIDYYNEILDKLEEAGIEPLVTLFHWDTPLSLAYFGGLWSNRAVVGYFTAFADLAFRLFGHRIKLWATINEPRSFCQRLPEWYNHYLPEAPLGSIEYLCGHHVLLAHANVYKLYQDKYKRRQKGRLAMTLDYELSIPLTNSKQDQEAAERAIAFEFGWFANPIVYGDYPKIMKDVIARNSARQNFSTSRLPQFTPSEKRLLKGSYDLFMINYYYTSKVTTAPYNNTPYFVNDEQILTSYDPKWPVMNIGFSVYPEGFREILRRVKANYKNPEIIITENGFSNNGVINDQDRIQFLKDMLQQVLLAMCIDGVKVTRYTYWSLLDSFEWNSGYMPKFGLVNVDLESQELKRTLKDSAYYYKELIKTHNIY